MNQSTKRPVLEITPDLFILRLKKDKIPYNSDIKIVARDFLNELPKATDRSLILIDSYPEADVTVWKVQGSRPATTRNQLISDIRILNDSRVDFVGRLRMRSDTKVYQIFTGNLFLCLHPGKEKNISRLCELYELRLKQERVAKLQFNKGAFYVETIKESQRVFEIADKIRKNHPDIVDVAEPELIVKRKTFRPKISATFTADGRPDIIPNNNIVSPTALGATSDRSANDSWIAVRTRLNEAQLVTKGKGAMIAIIDDGIESSHPAFQTQEHKAISRDFLGAENDPADHQYADEKHGTACASIAVSSDKLAPGVAPESRLLVARTKGLGSVLEAEAISWAANKGADVISCSWGPADGDPTNPDITPVRHPLPAATRFALKHAAEKGRNELGCLIVFAAGNGNEPLSPDEYANNPYVIAVGATNKKNQRSSYSDYGPELFCCFPSSDIRVVGSERIAVDGQSTADRLGLLGYAEGDYFHCFGGTSAAAPAVAGIAALVLSIAPQLKVLQLRHLLQVSCQIPNGVPGEKNNEFGYGILDALTAVKLAQKITGEEVDAEFNNPYKRLLELSPELEFAQFYNSQNDSKMNNKAVSLHIGVNQVNPDAYPGVKVPNLVGCVHDAKQWKSYAQEIGYTDPKILLDNDATRDNVKTILKEYASKLNKGDICLLTYSGHGSQIPTDDIDETDNYDETWLLHDGLLLDDEVDVAASKFKPGVRFVIIADSCHSGTSSKNVVLGTPLESSRSAGLDERERRVEPSVARSNYEANINEYKKLKIAAKDRPKTEAFVKLLPGCQDQQTSKEVNGEGMFTKFLLQILRDNPKGEKELNYNGLLEMARVPLFNYNQLPTVFDTGKRSEAFDNQYPLDIAIPKGLVIDEPENIVPDIVIDHLQDLAEGEDSKMHSNSSLKQPSQDVEIIIETKDSSKYVSKEGSSSLSNLEFRRGTKRSGITRDSSVPYDQAYQILSSNPDADIKYIEIDQSSKLGASPQVVRRNITTKSNGNDLNFMDEYPFPKSDHPNRIIWHLGDEYTQLRKASLLLHPEIGLGIIPSWNSGIPKVAMIDTGVRYEYPTLPSHLDVSLARSFTKKGKIISDESGQDRGLTPEKHGHGTATANLLAGGYLSSKDSPDQIWSGIIGAAPQMKIIPLRVSESVVILNPKAFASALRYAINIGADVVSMSMAGAPSNRMADAINEAYLKGVVVVSAGGNQWSSGVMGALPDALMYPARFDRVIAAVGVMYDGRPYRADLETSDVLARSEGGSTMGSCYGPLSVNGSVIAAYTPNTLWAGGDGDKVGKTEATMDGGGTSTATPQVAAAAAMWLELHGKALDAAINALSKTQKGKSLAHPKYGLRWIRSEAVRFALLNSALKGVGKNEDGKDYDHLYGNGVLQAYDALKYYPVSESGKYIEEPTTRIDGAYIKFNIDELIMASEADVSFGGLVEAAELLMSAYRAFGKRTRSTVDSADGYIPSEDELGALNNIIGAEIYSLLYSIEALRPFRKDPCINGKINPELALALLAIDDKLSETLRVILSPYAIKSNSNSAGNLSRGAEIVIPQLYALPASKYKNSNASKIIVVSDSAGIDVHNKRNSDYGDANDLQFEEFSIDVNTEKLRQKGPTDPLQVVIRPAPNTFVAETLNYGALAVLVERYDEQGQIVDYEWQYDGNKVFGTKSISERTQNEIGPGLLFRIDLQFPSIKGERGGGRLIKKIVGKVFKLFVRNKEGKFGKEVHRSYQLRQLDMSKSDIKGRLGKAFDITKRKLPKLDNLGDNGKSLLLIHGMFATTDSSFGKLFKGNDKIIDKIKEKYGSRVFAFEHPSVVESIDDNFQNLITLEKLLKNQKVDVVATSRGTHLARRMRLGADLSKTNKPLFDIDKAMYIGGTTFGTDIAREDRTLLLLKRITGMLAMSSKLLGPQIASVVKLLEKVVNKAGEAIITLPGISDQIPGSEALTQIANAYGKKFTFNSPNDLWVGANWQPTKNAKRIARLIDRVADTQIFGTSPSDGVAPLLGAIGQENSNPLPRSNNRIILNPTDIYHFTYFLDEEVLRGLDRHILKPSNSIKKNS